MTDRADVLLYTKPYCPYCVAAKALLREKGAAFREIDISGNDHEREEMMRRSGRRTVPQIFVGSTHVGGFDDLSALDRAGKLDALLGLTG
jgi:glutaredoxin 3